MNPRPVKPKKSNATDIELNVINSDYFKGRDDDYISIEPNGNSNSDLEFEERDKFNLSYEGILKSPFKLPKKRTKNKKRRARYYNSLSEYDDLNELLINEDEDETYNNYSRVPTSYQDSDDETLDDELDDNLSNNEYYLINQDEIPFVNLWSSFSKIFIKTILRSTKRYNTFEKEVRRNCLIGLLAVIFTSLIYLVIALYTVVMDGYSRKNIHDISYYSERTMIFSSLFLIFVSCLGLIGVRFKFKPMIVLYIIMNIISFSFHFYSIQQIHNTVIHAERDMAFAWWDIYTKEVIMEIQTEYNCCGYLHYTDKSVPISICPEDIVHRKVKYETIGPIPVLNQKKRFNKTFTIPDVGENYFTLEEMNKAQVKIEDNDKGETPKENNDEAKILEEDKEVPEKNKDANNGNAMLDIGIDIDLDNVKIIEKENKDKDVNLIKRKDILETIPDGCYTKITELVTSSLKKLCILNWVLSLSSPLALMFALIYCKSLELKKKSYEYF